MNQRGFTLVELMTAVAVVAIITTMALPSFRNLINSNKATSTAEELVNSLGLARSEALQRNGVVTVCASSTVNNSTPTCNSSATDWSTGWLVFVDSANDGVYNTGTDTLLRRGSPASQLTSMGLYTLTTSCTAGAAGATVKFRSFINLGGTTRVFKIVSGSTTKYVQIDNVGRISLPTSASPC